MKASEANKETTGQYWLSAVRSFLLWGFIWIPIDYVVEGKYPWFGVLLWWFTSGEMLVLLSGIIVAHLLFFIIYKKHPKTSRAWKLLNLGYVLIRVLNWYLEQSTACCLPA